MTLGTPRHLKQQRKFQLISSKIIWGNKNTIQWKGFDTNGMVFFESPEELYELIDSGIFNEEFYLSKKFSMLHNYNEVQKYLSFGDIVWDSIIREIE